MSAVCKEMHKYTVHKYTVPKYTALVLSGGGVHGFSMLGALSQLQADGLAMSDVEVLVGTSAGSLVAALMALGRSPREAMNKATKTPLLSRLQLNIDGFMSGRLGLDSGQGLEHLIDEALECNMTFEELKESTGKTLVVVVTSVHDQKAVYLSHETSPKCSINTAVKMSCCVPLLFDCVRYEGGLYVDGGLTNNFAVDCPLLAGHCVLGLRVAFEEKPNAKGRPRDNLGSYLGALLGIVINKSALSLPDNVHCIVIPAGPHPPLETKMTAASLQHIFSQGEQCAVRFLQKVP